MSKDEITDLNPASDAETANIMPDWQVDSAGNAYPTGLNITSNLMDSKTNTRKSKKSPRRQATSAYPLLR